MSARLDVERSILLLAACGVPVCLVIPPAGGPMLGKAGGGSFMVRSGPVAALIGAEERVGLSGRLDSPCVDGLRSTGSGLGIPVASGRRDGRVRGAGRVQVRLGRPGRRSPVESPVMQSINRHVRKGACGRGRRLDGLRVGGRRAFQPRGLVRLGGMCRKGGRSVVT